MLIKRYSAYDGKTMSDALCILAADIEEAYRKAGINDYTAHQCFDKAFELLKISWTRDDALGREFQTHPLE